MYSELEEISLVGMSNSELFQVEKDPKVIEFNILLRSTLEFSSDGFLIASSLSDDYHDHQLHHPQGPRLQLKQELEDEDEDDKLKQEEKKDRKSEGGVSSSDDDDDDDDDDEEVIKMRGAAARTRTLGGELEVEDNDGFRTPTSLDHGIPLIQQCPPAPRKPKPSPKRKPPSSTRHQLFLLDLSQEIGALFPPALLADHGPKNKKVRGGDHDTK